MLKKFSGSGGMFGGGSKPTETDDNLFSTDIVEAVLGVSEGPISGLKDGPKSFLLGDTPLKNVNNENNFDSFELVVRKGSDLGEKIVSRMGGFASSTTVATELASNVPVVRQGTHTSIDYVDIRLVINRLLRQTEDGTFNHTGKFKVEYKKTASPTWLPVSTITVNPPPQEVSSAYTDIYTELKPTDRVSASPGDRTVYRQNDPPGVPVGLTSALWFDANDNNKPYSLVSGSWVAIAGATFLGSTWTWTEKSAWSLNRVTRLFVVASPPLLRDQGDYWLNTDSNQILFFNGSSWIVAGTSLAPGGFGANDVSLGNGELGVTGKTTTSFVKEYRFRVDNITDDTYQFRVTKTSPNNTSEDFFDVSWESFQEVTAKPMQFPGLATVQLTARASEQFSSIPQFSGIYEGRVIRVPTNYDPVARTFTGLWDGTWKLAYSNNPAFVVYDLVSNDRYGLNAYYPVVLNKWDVYDAGVWCDTRTVEGVPRFKFNQLIDTARSCREAIDYICGLFGGRFFDDGNGSANIRIDKPESAAGIFTKENIVDGIFSYSFTEITNRYNDLTVTFKNPDLNFKEDRIRIFDQPHIDKYGHIPLNFIAVGCNSREEAVVRGRYKLVTGLAETAIVNFSTNRQGLYYVPYDIILIVDDDMQDGISGRVKNYTGPKSFELREPIYLEPGFNYKVLFQVPDGLDNDNFLVIERAIAPGTTGTLSAITTLLDLPAGLPEQAVFAISTTNDHAAPRPYRITRIDEVDGDPDNVEIQAVEVNRLKWDYVDGVITEIEDPDVYEVEVGVRTQPVGAVRIRAFNTLSGTRKVHNIILDWDASATKTTAIYKVYYSKDNGPQSLLGETGIQSMEWNDIAPGEYLFSVIAVAPVNGAMAESIPTTIEHRFIGDIPDPDLVQNFRMVEEAAPPIYARRSPIFQWDAITNPKHMDYVIRIYNLADVVIAQRATRETQYIYDYETNSADHSGVPFRSFKIGVASRDQTGKISAFSIVSANNPAPGVTVPTIDPGVSSAVINWNTTGIVDYLGAKIWISETSGFSPSAGTLKYEGGGNNFTFIGLPDVPYFLRIALFDDFNQTDFTVSPEYPFTVNGVDLDDLGEVVKGPLGYINNPGSGGLAAQLADLNKRIDDNALRITSGGLSDWSNQARLKRQISVQGAKFTEQIDVLSNETEAVAGQITVLEAEIDTATAAVVSESEARVQGDLASAKLIDEVAVELGSYSAYGYAGFQASATPDGATSRYAVVVRAQSEDVMGEAGLYFDTTPTESRVVVKSDQFYLTNTTADGNLVSPFYVVGGLTYIDNALIRNLTAASLTAGVINASSLIVDGIVVTGKIAAGAVTAADAVTVSGETTDTSMVSFYINPGAGERLIVQASCHMRSRGSGAQYGTMYLYKNSTIMAVANYNTDDEPSSWFALTAVDNNPSPATWSFYKTNSNRASQKVIQYILGKR